MTSDPGRVRVSGPLAGYAAGFGDELIRRGYPPERAARHVGLLAGLSRWLDQQGLAADEVTDGRVREFLELRRAEGYAEVPSQAWAMTLLGWGPGPGRGGSGGPNGDTGRGDGRGVPPLPGAGAGPGPGHRPRLYRGRTSVPVRPGRCGGLDLGASTAGDVRAYVVRECGRRRVGSAQVLVTGLGSLLRFLSVKGRTPHPLAAAVPAASGMRGGSLPRAVRPEVVAALLASCDSSTVAGRRDFAILTVLSRLGLRAGEVAGLELDDIDWHRGELAVRGKGGRRDRLPLPVDVGEALVAYLAGDRPHVSCRSVFLRVHAPITGTTSSNVSELVRRACRRAGVPVVSAHRLRHSAATALLQSGGSLAEVGQILRHSRAATTAMYAKVDRAALRALAQPWPGATA